MFLNIVIPEPPYAEKFNIGIVYNRNDQYDRKYILLLNCHTGSLAKHAYARYLFNINRIQNGLLELKTTEQVDHINDDPSDDRIENLQILTQSENTKKYWKKIFKNIPIAPNLIENLKFYIEKEYPYEVIQEKLGITQMYLRYLISEYISEHSIVAFAEKNISSIKESLSKGLSREYVGFIHGLDHYAIEKYIKKHLPEFTKEEIEKRRIDQIKSFVETEESISSISKKLGICREIVTELIRKNYPDYLEKRKKKMIESEEREKFLIENVKDMRSNGFGYEEIASKLKISYSKVRRLINKIPEYNRTGLLEKKLSIIKKSLQEKMTRNEISKILGVNYGNLNNNIKKYFPEEIQSRMKEVLNGESVSA